MVALVFILQNDQHAFGHVHLWFNFSIDCPYTSGGYGIGSALLQTYVHKAKVCVLACLHHVLCNLHTYVLI